ncbi:hypothetical protein [Alteromonas gracilis]|uniref:hypothetical protein n=1 Tax=Alteromonas gracilis TaxID=1479524 RepID=UPI003736CA0E
MKRSFFLTLFSKITTLAILTFLVDDASALTPFTKTNLNAEAIKIVKRSELDYQSHAYYSQLLELALSKASGDRESFALVETEGNLVQERVLRELSQGGEIDVFWTVTSKLREQQAIPVRVPLLNGIMGYRVSLIRQASLATFNNIRIGQQFKRLVGGQGHDWPDFKILEHNGFLTLGTSNYDVIIELLKVGRVDYFPRALHEAVVEAEALNNKAIIIEPKFIMYYPSYIFFFVSTSKPELAQRIEKGLRIAKQDGSFDLLFERYMDFDRISNYLNLSNRELIMLHNPLLSEETLNIQYSEILERLLHKK